MQLEVTGVAQGKAGHGTLVPNLMFTSPAEPKASIPYTALSSAPLLYTPRKEQSTARLAAHLRLPHHLQEAFNACSAAALLPEKQR